jgi:Zn-dependent protease
MEQKEVAKETFKETVKSFFKKEEIRDLIISILGITIIASLFDFSNTIYYLIIYSFSTIIRILVQKFFAKKEDLYATYSFDYNLFIVAIVIAILTYGGIIFPLLGYIALNQGGIKRLGKKFSNITSKEKGKIAFMGTLSHAIMVIVSMLFYSLSPYFFGIFISINSLMMIFSLLPFSKFDGSSILWWNRLIWVLSLLCAIILSFLASNQVNIILSVLVLIGIIIVSFVLWEKTF